MPASVTRAGTDTPPAPRSQRQRYAAERVSSRARRAQMRMTRIRDNANRAPASGSQLVSHPSDPRRRVRTSYDWRDHRRESTPSRRYPRSRRRPAAGYRRGSSVRSGAPEPAADAPRQSSRSPPAIWRIAQHRLRIRSTSKPERRRRSGKRTASAHRRSEPLARLDSQLRTPWRGPISPARHCTASSSTARINARSAAGPASAEWTVSRASSGSSGPLLSHS